MDIAAHGVFVGFGEFIPIRGRVEIPAFGLGFATIVDVDEEAGEARRCLGTRVRETVDEARSLTRLKLFEPAEGRLFWLLSRRVRWTTLALRILARRGTGRALGGIRGRGGEE